MRWVKTLRSWEETREAISSQFLSRVFVPLAHTFAEVSKARVGPFLDSIEGEASLDHRGSKRRRFRRDTL